ncbi:MAG: amidohydrolase family protein [Chloroflexi bacterium]|nr:amidohydrolase family protein [Chloroflexota bacterium]
MASLLLKGARVLDLTRPFEVADVLVDHGQIVRVEPELDQPADRVLDLSGKLLMPGLINAHTHSGQIVDRGMGDADPLDLWIVHAAYSGSPMDPRDLYTLAAWSALVQLRTGCTACLDHPFVPPAAMDEGGDAIMQAYLDTGFRAAVALAVGDMDLFQTLPLHLIPDVDVPKMAADPPKTEDQLAGLRRFLQRWQGKSDRVRPFAGPSAPQRATDDLLDGCFELAREFEAGLHTHVYEARSQVHACQERFGVSAVEHFKRKGWISPRLSCAHGVWLSQQDMRLLADGGGAVAHNPVSNLRLASGIADLQRMLSAGVTVALGADGAASNDNQNMWEVVKLTAILHRMYGRRRDWVTAEEALRVCLEGGAAVMGQRLGAVAPGSEADLIVLGGRELFFRPKQVMIPALVLGELGASVETAIVAGEVVLENGQSTKVNEAHLRMQVAEIVQKSMDSLPRREQFFRERQGILDKMLSAVEAQEDPDGILIPGVR